jgi:hypothetical protein
MVVRTGQTLNNDAIGPDTQYIVSATIVCMYVFIAWRIWRRQGAIAAFLLLVLAIPGPLRNVFALAFGTFNLMDAAVSFLVFLLAINGFRGTSAHRKLLMAEGKVKPRPQPPWVKR